MNDATAGSRGTVCMLLHGHFPMEVRVAAEVRAAMEAGFDVDVIALRGVGEEPEEVVDGARVLRLPIRHEHGAGPVATAKEYIGFTVLAGIKAAGLAPRRRYAIVQVHNPPDFLLLAALGPRLLGARIVLDVHDLAPDMFNMRFGDRRGAGVAERILRFVEKLAIRAADSIVTVHEPYRQELISRGAKPERVEVVLNSLDERLLPTPEARPLNGSRIVYHGTVTPHYGVELLVEAAAEAMPEIPDLSLRIYGQGDSLTDVVERAAALGIGEAVWVSPEPLSQKDVLRAIQYASVGVVPNLPLRLNRFALSTKLFEYVALGIPVVSADLPTIRAYFSHEEVTYFRAGDAKSLARALVRTLQDPDAAKARALAARARYEEYRWPVNAARYTDVLDGTSPEELAHPEVAPPDAGAPSATGPGSVSLERSSCQ